MNTKRMNGFTIIEVVLVLAIAALIFLMVFIALPALQASQRDTARKNDVSTVSAAVNSFISNNSGSFPNAAQLRQYATSVSENTNADSIQVRTFSANVTVDDSQIVIVTGARCAATGPNGAQTLTSGTRRQYVTITRLESGDHTSYCLES